MKWYLKSLVQNAFAWLPNAVADPLYYQLQRRLGELKSPRFDMRLRGAANMVEALAPQGGVQGKRVLEIGTGRSLDVPIALWLMGAREVVTTDIARLLRPEIVEQAVDHLVAEWGRYRPLFVEWGDERGVDERFAKLREFRRERLDEAMLERLLALMSIDYRAPVDATRLALAEKTVDVCVTFVVLQHVPRDAMVSILREARRVLRKDGCMVHVANTSDHFSHVDATLSPLHFLRWSNLQWQIIAGNRFIYQNRMRADDYYAAFREAGLELAEVDERVDEVALADLEAGLPLHPDWRGRDPKRSAVIRFRALCVRDDAAPLAAKAGASDAPQST